MTREHIRSIERQVMASVAVIYTTRLFVSTTAIKLYILLISAGGIVAFVSVSNVIHNLESVAHGGAPSIAVFIVSAIVGTTLVVQLALALSAAAFVSLLTPAFSSFRRSTFA